MNSESTFQTICSFLQPLELNQCRYLSKHHANWVNRYTTSLCKSRDCLFIEQICPKCANWIDFRDISKLTHFFDNYTEGNLQSIVETNRVKNVKKFLGDGSIRSYLFCEECDYEECNINDISSFPYKGERTYHTLQMRHIYDIGGPQLSLKHKDNWVIIFSEGGKCKKWNEFRSYNYMEDEEYEEW